MATDAEEIAQLALAHLGDDSDIDDITTTPSSRPEILASRFYTIARNHCLVQHPWPFAKRKTLLVLHDTSDEDANLEEEWVAAYDLPTGVLRILKVVVEGAPKHRPSEDFEMFTEADGTTLLFTNAYSGDTDDSEVYAEYIWTVTDTTKFPDEFTLALAYYLAHLLAAPLIAGAKGISLADRMFQLYQNQMAQAWALQARQHQISEEYPRHTPSWLLGR